MSVLGAILLVLAGLAIMAFGIFLFYAWLPARRAVARGRTHLRRER